MRMTATNHAQLLVRNARRADTKVVAIVSTIAACIRPAPAIPNISTGPPVAPLGTNAAPYRKNASTVPRPNFGIRLLLAAMPLPLFTPDHKRPLWVERG